MGQEFILWFLAIFFLGTLNNWLIPLAIYKAKFGLFKKRPKNFVGCNAWGVVMDVVLAGLANITVLNYLLTIRPLLGEKEILLALVVGFAVMVGVHVWMAVTFWKEWIMPSPFRWNAGGYWHMVSMTLQMAYLFCPITLVINNPILLSQPITWATFILIGILGLLFLGALSVKNKTVKLGYIVISGESW